MLTTTDRKGPRYLLVGVRKGGQRFVIEETNDWRQAMERQALFERYLEDLEQVVIEDVRHPTGEQ